MSQVISGNIVDVYQERIFPAEITVSEGKIRKIKEVKEEFKSFILPGLVDSHIHIESSMLTPSEFAKLAVRHGTVAVVSDPHEIANVIGIEGIDFMIGSGGTVPFKFFFGAPSCVPATEYESSGARLDHYEIRELLKRDDIYFLSEMMNFPGVISGEESILSKIRSAAEFNKPVDGHAPGLSGHDLDTYIKAGISTDHECVTLKEAEEKLAAGMKIQIREGSAAKGFEIFWVLIDRFPDSVMLCSDDLHPDELVEGHINKLLSRGRGKGINIYNLIRAATVNPVSHYKLPVGLLREGDDADMIIVKDLENFEVIETYINGVRVYGERGVEFKSKPEGVEKKFRTRHVGKQEISLMAGGSQVRVIEVLDGELYTRSKIVSTNVKNGYAISDPKRDICKIVVLNKYSNNQPSVGFISGFGLKKGAIAGSVAHDSHNIIAVGVDDNDIADAINTILDMGGGLAVVSQGRKETLQLEIAGLMTNQDGHQVARRYRELDGFSKVLGSELHAPFMSLSFMSLLVIPELKISDRGLFDVSKFKFTEVFTG